MPCGFKGKSIFCEESAERTPSARFIPFFYLLSTEPPLWQKEGMKTACTLLVLAFALSACHHDEPDSPRRYTPNSNYRHTDDSERRSNRSQYRTQRREEQRHTDDMNTLPYLPPFTMRWDCPAEPQMLGYMTR